MTLASDDSVDKRGGLLVPNGYVAELASLGLLRWRCSACVACTHVVETEFRAGYLTAAGEGSAIGVYMASDSTLAAERVCEGCPTVVGFAHRNIRYWAPGLSQNAR
jgi:hypothetical protein